MEELKQTEHIGRENGVIKNEVVHIKSIDFGNYEIDTTLPSNLQDELNQESYTSGELYVCEVCLLYNESLKYLDSHKARCKWVQPKGKEIYSDDKLSVFEIDGEDEEVYCSRLCLFSKLFLNDKQSSRVEDFLFYVLTSNKNERKNMIGYFSKEKDPDENHNMSCLLVLPQYQRKGFGRFLIHFSFILSRIEGIPGTPEKPLSKLGWLCYHSYWRYVIACYVYRHLGEKSITVKEISKHTGIDPFDIGATLQMLNLVKQRNGSACIAVKPRALLKEIQASRRSHYHEVNEKYLNWLPTSKDVVQDSGLQQETALNTSNVTNANRTEKRQSIAPDDTDDYNSCSKKIKIEADLF